MNYDPAALPGIVLRDLLSSQQRWHFDVWVRGAGDARLIQPDRNDDLIRTPKGFLENGNFRSGVNWVEPNSAVAKREKIVHDMWNDHMCRGVLLTDAHTWSL